MTDKSKAYWVGALFLFVLILILVFAWLMGAVGPFKRTARYTVLYGFAGGVDVGSPVRVSGIKAGKVDNVQFLSEDEGAKNADTRASVKIGLSVARNAARHIRADSSFYINMAGVIGERYIEISPGTEAAAILPENSTVRGIDPPRIDQLLSQGYGVFGRVQEFLEQNEKTLTEFIMNMTRLMGDANRLLKGDDRKRLIALIENLADLFAKDNTDKLVSLMDNLNAATNSLRSQEAKKVYQQLIEMVDRAHDLDKNAIKKFLQEEGIRAHLF